MHACVCASVLECVRACVPEFVRVSVHACLSAREHACLSSCVRPCMRERVLAKKYGVKRNARKKLEMLNERIGC